MRELQRAVIYGKPRQRECSAVSEGLRALGAAVVWRNQGYSEASNILDDVDVAVTFGQRLHSGRVAEVYRGRGVPVLTVDLPPLRHDGMEQTHRSLWLDEVNWTPDGARDLSRLGTMRLGYIPMREDRGSKVLVCGQTADDAAHGMDSRAIRHWTIDTLNRVSQTHTAIWRPHPHNIFAVPGFAMSEPATSLDDVLREDWHAVVTYNSTSGLTALLAGIPVYCDPSCFYFEVAQADLERPDWPSEHDWLDYFSRLSHAQWTFEELSSGEALEFILRETNKIRPSMAA